jgi:hypothetical protein
MYSANAEEGREKTWRRLLTRLLTLTLSIVSKSSCSLRRQAKEERLAKQSSLIGQSILMWSSQWSLPHDFWAIGILWCHPYWRRLVWSKWMNDQQCNYPFVLVQCRIFRMDIHVYVHIYQNIWKMYGLYLHNLMGMTFQYTSSGAVFA